MIKRYGSIEFDDETGMVRVYTGSYHGSDYHEIIYDPSNDTFQDLGDILDRVFKQGQEEIRNTFKKLLDIKDKRY